ncbi:MAG: ATPase domain-containing protein [Gemmatimonadota bacterium]
MITIGVAPLDERLGGIRQGGIYLLAGAPGSGKLALILHFLQEGIRAGERVGLVCASPPGNVFEQARHFGIDLEDPWRSDRLALVGFRGDYPRRILHAADPDEAFAELGLALGGPVSRLGLDPSTLLWETRAGTDMAARFLNWTEALGATVWGTLTSDLAGDLSQPTEWVLGRAAGAFHLAVLPSGLRELTVRRLNPPADDPGPITLEYTPGEGIVAPTGRLDRRRTDPPAEGSGRLLLLRLASQLPEDIGGWMRGEYEVTEVADPLRLISYLHDHAAFGTVLLYLERSRMDEAIQVCRTVRPITRGCLVLVSDEAVRASDRARALDAGADDFLSGDVDVRELRTRMRRATEKGRERRPGGDASEEGRPPLEPMEGILPEEAFGAEVRRRLASTGRHFFTVVWFRDHATLLGRLGPILRQHIRAEAGDFCGEVGDGFGVVLQDSRARQAQAFLERVGRSLKEAAGPDARIEAEVLTSPGDAGRIEARVSA